MKPTLTLLTVLLLAPLTALHATMLHLFVFDHTRFTSRLRRMAFPGRRVRINCDGLDRPSYHLSRDFRLTEVYESVVKEILT
jgi:hypothetical protein